MNSALRLQGRKPNDYSSKININLDPEMRADIAIKYIYSHLLKAIKDNEQGAIADIDSEFLHDFRVAGFAESASYFTGLTSGANPPIRTSRRSPEAIGPTPLGVPVRMISPGSRVRLVEIKLTR